LLIDRKVFFDFSIAVHVKFVIVEKIKATVRLTVYYAVTSIFSANPVWTLTVNSFELKFVMMLKYTFRAIFYEMM
jgi:hypothetical protein